MRDDFEEVLLHQTDFSARNTTEMRRRGILVRQVIPAELGAWMGDLATASGITDLHIQGKDGQGNKTVIPWVRVHSESRSAQATQGWYVVYLFSAEGDRVYLSLNQGTTQWNGADFIPRSRHQLLARVAWARQLLTSEPDFPDDWVDTIELDSRVKLGKGYEVGNVVAKEYLVDSIPSDDVLEADLTQAVRWLSKVYAAEALGLYVPGEVGPELADAELAIEQAAGNSRRGTGQGFRLTTAEKKAIELRAVKVATKHLQQTLGYTVEDVGTKRSYDLHCTLAGSPDLLVEVKGTTSPGEEVLLTRNEVTVQGDAHPNNALAVVHTITLDRSGATPSAAGGTLSFRHPWVIDEADLTPIAYRYKTGIQAPVPSP